MYMYQQLVFFLQESIPEPVQKLHPEGVEGTIVTGVQWLKLGIETVGAIIIGIGVVLAVYYFIVALIPPQMESYNKIRLVLARYLALALEFQLGADILSTAIAPTWDQIGKLGAIAVIRTLLNYFLTREMKEERQISGTAEDRTLAPPAADKG
ncbi:DUF1622 domain-containing protein [Pontibacter anaerobius]|uniref:DUF1622 domain-containing protein n=1 Tax=Pontibacter anaerobius TaxID=2993940 RepID=A0ABT3RFD7_9BACT|nr:DUF1622 domain-containing protein [Pontibacter anaerobius]MCX2740344.1 DUF1622 domain-containing protein [Pontibacter anaerobius]